MVGKGIITEELTLEIALKDKSGFARRRGMAEEMHPRQKEEHMQKHRDIRKHALHT